MIQAILAAAKAATWAQRGISAGVVIGVVAAVFGWGYLKGHAACSQQTTQAALDQAMTVAHHEAQKADTLARVDETHDARARSSSHQAEVITRDVIKVVEKVRPVQLDPEYRRVVAELQRVQRDAENRVSQTDTPSAETAALRAATITTNQLLLAYTDLANARRQDLELITYVKAFEQARYQGEMAFYDGLPATARSEE